MLDRKEIANRMNLNQALNEFDSGNSRKFTPQDIERIHGVVDELGLTQFEVKYKDSGRLYIHDLADIVHIHPSMVVSQRKFRRSIDRGAKPYPAWPHFLPLDRWVERG